MSFYPFDQDEYLEIVAHWLTQFGVAGATIEARAQEALQWALQRGSRSGRVAWQFARDWAGRMAAPSSGEAARATRSHVAPVEVAAAVLDGRTAVPAGAAPGGQGLRRLLGVSRRQGRAGRGAAAALARELHEELGIDVERAYPWLTRDYDYRTPPCGCISSACALARRAARPRGPGASRGSASTR